MRLAAIVVVLAITGATRAARALSLPKISVTRAERAADCPGAAALSAATDALILRAGPVPRDDADALS